jgi:N-acyl-D-aspartate/D-glutamate deacylase
MSDKFDLIVRGGTVCDGLGSSLRQADVAVKDGRIAVVGKVAGSGLEEIDARGMLVTPGFVDIHTHYDGQATWENTIKPSSWHGVTTVVMGNCGVGFAPVRPGDRDSLIELMEGVEDIPGSALHEGLRWNWESFGEYLDVLDQRTFDLDVCAQLPHAPLRLYVMGQRAVRHEAATIEDRAKMRELTRQAVEAGAFGFSTSRSVAHKSARGDVTWSYRAQEEELTAIALGLKDAGRGVLQWVSDWHDQDAELAMILRIARASGRPLSISVGQSHAFKQDWRKILATIAQARDEGLALTGQVAPRPVGMMLGLTISTNPFSHSETMSRIAARPLSAKIAAMRDPEFRRAVIAEAERNPIRQDLYGPSRVFPVYDTPDYGQDPQMSVAAIAGRTGRPVNEVMYDLLMEDGGKRLLFSAVMNYLDHNYEAIAEMLAHPNTVMGLGDGGAHVAAIVDGSFPTTALSYWGRDAAKDGDTALATMVRRQTSATAAAVGLRDRGAIARGMKPDINVIDLAALAVGPLRASPDLPGGATRLLQGAKGYVATIVSGTVTHRDGTPTGDLPGRLVRSSATSVAGPV